MVQSILIDLENALVSAKQTTLTGPNFDEINELCVKWLKKQGYSVHSPVKYSNKPKSYDDLFNLFYELFKKHYPEHVVPYNGDSHDRKIAKEFVESRMGCSGIDKPTAMAQCMEIIEALFLFKDQLNLDKTPNFGIFTPSMGWFVGKIIDKINEHKEKAALKRIEAKVEEQTRLIESSFAPKDLMEI